MFWRWFNFLKINYNLFYLYINKSFYKRESLFTIIRNCASFIINDFRNIFKSDNNNPDSFKNIKDKNVLVIDSLNNYLTLKFLEDRISNNIFLSLRFFNPGIHNIVVLDQYSLSGFSLKKWFFFLVVFLKKRGDLNNSRLFLKYFSLHERYIKLFENFRPKSIIISNDHYPTSRAVILAAKELNIKCVYIQHASVSPLFPPLENSHALLYGQFSENIYRKIGARQCDIIQVGMHQFDRWSQTIRDKKFNGHIGIAFNTFDSIEAVGQLYNKLKENFPLSQVIVRPHPVEKRSFPSFTKVSDARKENPLQFLSNIDVLIAGNSSLLLEAACMKVWPVQFEFGHYSKEFKDYYKFVEKGLALDGTLDNIESLISEILEKRELYDRNNASFYDASVGKDFEYHVQDNISKIIKQIIEA